MYHIFFSFTFALMFLISIQSTYANVPNEIHSEKVELRVGLIEFPPLSTVSSENECYGNTIEVLTEIFKNTNYKLVIYCSSPSRVYRDFNAGLIDLTINVKTTEALSKNALFSEAPFAMLTVSIFEKKEASTNHKKISSVRFYSYHNMRAQLEDQGYTFYDSNNTKESIAVFIRENDYKLVSYSGPFHYYLGQIAKLREVDSIRQGITENVLVQAESYFMVNNFNTEAKNIKKIIDSYYRNN